MHSPKNDPALIFGRLNRYLLVPCLQAKAKNWVRTVPDKGLSSAPTDASFIFAMYAAARTIPLALMALIAIYKHSEPALLILGTLAGFIQLLDAGVGLLQHDLGKSIGPLVIAAFQFFVVYLLSRSARSRVD
jgi:hypothetical protein